MRIREEKKGPLAPIPGEKEGRRGILKREKKGGEDLRRRFHTGKGQ